MADQLPRDLGDGLILRRATSADADAIVDLIGDVFRVPSDPEPNRVLMTWARDLATGNHPTFRVDDILVVEDSPSGQVVSSLNLISQRWSYDGIEFGVGRPELVCTRPEYRRRGLIRAQLEVVHQWSTARGEQVQVITGIPYFYRQFGYEMAIDLHGGRAGQRELAPRLPDGEDEPFRVRPATRSDAGFVAETHARAEQRYLLSAVRSRELWEYEITGRTGPSNTHLQCCLIERPTGEPVGYLAHASRLVGRELRHVLVTGLEVVDGVSWLAVVPTVIRYLVATGDRYAEADRTGAWAGWYFGLGLAHPVYEAARRFLPTEDPPYAYYVRVPDLPAFLETIAPSLDRRLAASPARGHSGDLTLSFYRSGVSLRFDRGRLVRVQSWKPTVDERGMARFPDLTFLQLLFGYRSLAELQYAFPDCGVGSDEARVLLNALFPKRPSNVWPIS